jgi:apolipoprotein N-acyltransferase
MVESLFFNKRGQQLGYLLLSAALLTLSFPKPSWSILSWIAFIPLFKALENQPARRRLALGYTMGFIYSLGVFYWVTHSMRFYGHLSLPISISMLVLLALYLALFPAVFGLLWGLFPAGGLFSLIWAPALWVGLEYLRAVLLSGFPWALVGYSQYTFLPLIQVAEFTGVYGLSFLIIIINQALYQLFLKSGHYRPWSAKWGEAVLAGGLLLLVIAYGYAVLPAERKADDQSKKLEVSIIQGNIDQSLKWNTAFQEKTVNIYTDLSNNSLSELSKIKPEVLSDKAGPLLIWPETAVPFYFLNEQRLSGSLFKLSRETNSYLLFGSPAVGQQNNRLQYYNRAYLLSPSGQVAYYDKVHLVPFGEYVPLKRFLPFVHRMVESIGEFSTGPRPYGLDLPQGKIGVLICFETIFPEISRALRQDGCRLLVNITNDAWFGRTSAPYQHLSMLTLRAVENRVWIARAANTGFSALIDSSGRIVRKSSLFEKATIQAIIPMREGSTFYSRHGDWLVGFCFLAVIGGLLAKGRMVFKSRIKKRR